MFEFIHNRMKSQDAPLAVMALGASVALCAVFAPAPLEEISEHTAIHAMAGSSLAPAIQMAPAPRVAPVVRLAPASEIVPEPEPEVDLVTAPEIVPEAEPEEDLATAPEVVPDPEPEIVPDVEPVEDLATAPEVVPDPEPEVAALTAPETAPDLEPEVEHVTAPDAGPDLEPEVEHVTVPEPAPEPEVEHVTAPAIVPVPKPKVVLVAAPVLPVPKPKVLLTALSYAHAADDDSAQTSAPKGAKRVQGLLVASASPNWKVKGLRPDIMRLLQRVQRHYGKPLHIISGCRSKKHNRRVRGAKRSQHLYCKAADFKIAGVSKHKLVAYLKSMPGRGGVGLYCRSSYVHLDTGPKRYWYYGCGKRRKYRKRRVKKQYASVRAGKVSK